MILNQSVHVFSLGYFLIYYASGSSSLTWQFYCISFTVKLTASGLRTPVRSSTAEEPTPLKSTQLKSTLLKKSNTSILQSETVSGEAIIHDDLDEAFSNLSGLSVVTLYNCIDLISSLEESREHFFKAGAMQILWCRLLTANSSTVQQIALATEMLLTTFCCMTMLGKYYTGKYSVSHRLRMANMLLTGTC